MQEKLKEMLDAWQTMEQTIKTQKEEIEKLQRELVEKSSEVESSKNNMKKLLDLVVKINQSCTKAVNAFSDTELQQ